MQAPTHLPAARIARHEEAGQWPGESFSALLDARATDSGDRVYCIAGSRTGDTTHTFGDLKRRADRMAVALAGLGVRPGDVVSYQIPNWFEAVAFACAVDRIGAVQNPIITIYREREVGFACRQASAKVLVVPGVVRGVDHRELARTVQSESPDLEHVVTLRAEPLPGQRALESLERDPTAPLGPSPLGPHDVSFILYTSGTTADPKGVLHTSSTLGGVNWLQREIFGVRADERGLLQFPLMHMGGVAMFVRALLHNGTSAVFTDGFDAELAVDLIERLQITSAGGPPALLQGIMAASNFSSQKLRSVRVAGSGAADVSPDLIRSVGERFGCFAYRSFGMTECPMVTSGRPDDPKEKCFQTAGRPSPGCTVRAVDDAGRPVPAGVEGELELFGPQMCVGYADPALNVAFTSDGFVRSGDLGIIDAEGYVRITGRRKDVIIRKGENLSAKGIEDDLAAHPDVVEVAVVGVPDRDSGERVCACVVMRDGAAALTLPAVRDFMRARGVMMQKIPEQLELMPELPRNATGKVRKDQLRARLRA
jgi:non-ribosomal peptide synthetase component E (peptide arylation enzyme)